MNKHIIINKKPISETLSLNELNLLSLEDLLVIKEFVNNETTECIKIMEWNKKYKIEKNDEQLFIYDEFKEIECKVENCINQYSNNYNDSYSDNYNDNYNEKKEKKKKETIEKETRKKEVRKKEIQKKNSNLIIKKDVKKLIKILRRKNEEFNEE